MPDPRAALSSLVSDWMRPGRSQASFARDVLGRDAQLLADWLAGKPMPAALADWIARVDAVTVVTDRVRVTVRPKPLDRPGRKRTQPIASP